MGIRFRCHQCGHELHVKDFQGGKRSKCPECETKFRIPAESAEYSIPLDLSQRDDSALSANSQAASVGTAMETLPAKSTLSMQVPLSEQLPEDQLQNEFEGGAQNDVSQEIDAVSHSANLASTPHAIQEAPGATWYVRPPAGGQYGPAPANIFCEWLTENRVTRDSLVWRDGWPQWLVAGDVFADYFGPAFPPASGLAANGLAASGSLASAPAASAPAYPPATSSFGPGSQPDFPVAEQTPAPEFPAVPQSTAPTSLSDRALAARKRQRKKNYMIMIVILATISIGLVIALAVVLMRNS